MPGIVLGARESAMVNKSMTPSLTARKQMERRTRKRIWGSKRSRSREEANKRRKSWARDHCSQSGRWAEARRGPRGGGEPGGGGHREAGDQLLAPIQGHLPTAHIFLSSDS